MTTPEGKPYSTVDLNAPCERCGFAFDLHDTLERSYTQGTYTVTLRCPGPNLGQGANWVSIDGEDVL